MRFLAKGDYLSEVADMHGVSLSSASRIIHIVCSVLCLCVDNIRFPTSQQELKKVKDEFFNIQGFPNVVGAIDGTLVPIQGMAGMRNLLSFAGKDSMPLTYRLWQ